MQKTTKQYDNIDELCEDILKYKHIEIESDCYILVITVSDILKNIKYNEIDFLGHGIWIKYDPEISNIVLKKVSSGDNQLYKTMDNLLTQANTGKLRFVKATKIAKMYSLYRQIEQKINPLFDYALEI